MKLLTVKWLLKLIKLPNFVVSTAAVDGLAPPDHDDVVIKWKHFPRYWPFVREFTGPGEAQRPVTRSFDVFFDLRLNKRLSKQRWGWWFETPSWSLWRHGNVQRYNHITRRRNYQVKFGIRVVTDTSKIKNDTGYVTVQWNKNVSLTLSEILRYSWWRHQMETFSALLAFRAGNSPVTGEFPAQRPVTRSFYGFFHLHLNRRLSKQS